MTDEKSEGTTFKHLPKPDAAEGLAGSSNGLAKSHNDHHPAFRTDNTLFDAHRAREQPKRYAIYGITGLALGALVYEVARLTGIMLPEYIGIPLLYLAAIGTWKASKPILRRFMRGNPETATQWQKMSDQEILAYVRRRLQDLSVLAQHRGWRDIYAELEMIPEQLPVLLKAWRKANRDRERLEARQTAYSADENKHLEQVRSAIKEAIDATKKRSNELEAVICLRIASFDTSDASFSKAQHTSGSDDSAIQTARESIQKINDEADSILKAIKEINGVLKSMD